MVNLMYVLPQLRENCHSLFNKKCYGVPVMLHAKNKTTYHNLGASVKAVLRGKFVVVIPILKNKKDLIFVT